MADYIRPTPRNPILGLLADALTGGVDWMRDPRRTQQMQGIGGLLAETGIPGTMERLSYGEPLTKGKGMTTRLRPEAESALMTLGPEAVPIGRGAMAAVRATKGLPVGAGIRQVAPQEEALRLAQQRAALPVSEGGLGLPPNNTPMDRARAMGFDIPAFHASSSRDIQAFDNARLGQNTAYNTDSSWAQSLARKGHWFAAKDLSDDMASTSYATYPVLLQRPTRFYKSLDDAQKGRSLPAVSQVIDEEFGTTSYIVKDPSRIRSRFAAFDPTRRNEADLLAGALPFTALLDEENRALLEERLGGLLGR